jgi:hypothetical protein
LKLMIDFNCSATKVYTMEMITWLETGRLYNLILLVDTYILSSAEIYSQVQKIHHIRKGKRHFLWIG